MVLIEGVKANGKREKENLMQSGLTSIFFFFKKSDSSLVTLLFLLIVISFQNPSHPFSFKLPSKI